MACTKQTRIFGFYKYGLESYKTTRELPGECPGFVSLYNVFLSNFNGDS